VTGRPETGAPWSRTVRTKALPFLVSFVASWVAYIITLFMVGGLLFRDVELRGEASTAFVVALSVALGLHFMLAMAGSALVARVLNAPVLLTTTATAFTIVIAWLTLLLFQ
jgi:hypothetical protein